MKYFRVWHKTVFSQSIQRETFILWETGGILEGATSHHDLRHVRCRDRILKPYTFLSPKFYAIFWFGPQEQCTASLINEGFILCKNYLDPPLNSWWRTPIVNNWKILLFFLLHIFNYIGDISFIATTPSVPYLPLDTQPEMLIKFLALYWIDWCETEQSATVSRSEFKWIFSFSCCRLHRAKKII